MPQPLAVLGIDVQVPGAPSFAALMRMLDAGHVNAGDFPAHRLIDASLTTAPEDHYQGGYFEHIDRFDHRFFKVSAKVAAAMDPFQRWCLLSSVRAVHDAGLAEEIRGTNVGVFASCNGLQQSRYAELQRAHGGAPDLMAVLHSGIAARISHHLDLHGPALMIDTACSSSLYALTLACAQLDEGAIDTAIVTTANLYLDPGERGSAAVDVVSPRSRTRAFDLAADGASTGEGVVTLVLRRAADAGSASYGLVAGWATGQDGRTATIAAPNPAAQRDIIEAAWAGIETDPSDLGLLVAHGTGTAVGDVVELEALSAVAAFQSVPRGSVPLLSPKANVGHLDSASGLLSLVAALGAVSTGRVPRHPAFVAPAEGLDLAGSPFYIPVEVEPMDGSLAGVSSFGMSGTHAHVVVAAGTRVPGDGADLDLELSRYWYAGEHNTFAKPEVSRHSALGVVSAVYPIETFRDWEIAEHRVDGTPLMVGTSVVEIITRLLDGTEVSLQEYDLVDLTILRPLTSTDPRVQIQAAVDSSRLVGEIAFREGSGQWQPWVRFGLAATDWTEPLRSECPDFTGLSDVPVETVVGDGETVSVSGRWSVARQIGRHPSGEWGLLQLAPPAAHAAEFERYHHYPPLLDAALNGLNTWFGDDEVLLPWLCGRIRFHAPALRGDTFRTHIVHRGTTRDERGNVIVTLDVDLWNDSGDCVLSARGYRVKNRVGETATTVDFHRVEIDSRPATRSGPPPTLAIVLPDGADSRGWAGPDRVVTTWEQVLAVPERIAPATEVVVLLPNATEISDDCFDVGRLLLRLHSVAAVDKVVLLAPGAMSGGDPAERARAATAYSLRTEFRFDVAVLDGPAIPATLSTIAAHDLRGLARIEDDVVSEARFREVNVTERPWPVEPGGHILVAGASTGIGRAYAEWLATTYPQLRVTGCGRRERPDGPVSFHYVQADITDAAALSRLATLVGTPDQIVMSAGEPANGLFVTKDAAAYRARMASKVFGPRLLAETFPGTGDIVLVSSVSGYVGAMGQGEYAAANAHLTGLAEATGLGDNRFRCLSLSGWSEIGMARDLTDDVFVKTGAKEGLALLHRFVTSNERCLSLFRVRDEGRGYSPLFARRERSHAAPTPVTTTRAPQPRNQVNVPAQGIEASVRGAWERVLGSDNYESTTTFFEYGGDSVSVVALSDELGRVFPDVFDVTTLFSCATIADQTRWVEDSLVRHTAVEDVVVDIAAMQQLLHANGGSL